MINNHQFFKFIDIQRSENVFNDIKNVQNLWMDVVNNPDITIIAESY